MRLIIRSAAGDPSAEADTRSERNSGSDDGHRVSVSSDQIAWTFAIPATTAADPGPSRSNHPVQLAETNTDRHSNEILGASVVDVRARTSRDDIAYDVAHEHAGPSDPRASDDTPPAATTRTEYNTQLDHTTIIEFPINNSEGGHEHPVIGFDKDRDDAVEVVHYRVSPSAFFAIRCVPNLHLNIAHS